MDAGFSSRMQTKMEERETELAKARAARTDVEQQLLEVTAEMRKLQVRKRLPDLQLS